MCYTDNKMAEREVRVMKYLIGLLLLCAIVLFHEFGHFIAAKACGVYVEEFAMGMGPTLLRYKSKSGTVYALHLFPIGGFCAMKGENGENMDSDSFMAASCLKRIAIVAAGPFFNLLLAFVVGIFLVLSVGQDYAYVSTMNEVASEAGLQEGDRIVGFQGNHIGTSRELYVDEIFFDENIGETVNLKVIRDGKKLNISYPVIHTTKYIVGMSSREDEDGNLVVIRVLSDSAFEDVGMQAGDIITSINGVKSTKDKGLQSYFDDYPLDGSDVEIVYERDGVSHQIVVAPREKVLSETGFSYTVNREKHKNVLYDACVELEYDVHMVIRSLTGLLTGRFGFNDLSGPVGIVKMVGDEYESAAEETDASVSKNLWVSLISMLVMISVNLGIMNIIPLPALDGGHLLFLFIELIRRKPVSPKIEARIHQVGFSLLMIFSCIIIMKDMFQYFI